MVDYVLTGFKWGSPEQGTPAGPITWSFAQSPGDFAAFDQYIDDPDYRALVRDAFDAWEAVAGIDFVEVEDTRDVNIRLGWSAIDGKFGQVGLTGNIEYQPTSPGTLGEITEVEMMFDLAEDWVLGKSVSPSGPSFYATAVHEIGHALGLDHTFTTNNIMFVEQSLLDFTDLQLGDIAGAQALYGLPAVASALADVIGGTSGPDTLNALGGNDKVTGGRGDDAIDGGPGVDTAVYFGKQASYTVKFASGQTVIDDRRPDQDGTDTLVGIEVLQFADGSFEMELFSGATELSAEEFSAITELYIAYFNRAPDAAGLLYWATRFADGMELPQIAKSFFVQPETQETYAAFLDDNGNLVDTDAFVAAVYRNLLGREPDKDGAEYWSKELATNPDITPAIFILAAVNGAKAASGSAEDAKYLASKTDVGIYFSAIRGISDYDDSIAVMDLYDGSSDSIAAAVAETDRLHSEALDPQSGEFLLELVGVIDDPFAMA